MTTDKLIWVTLALAVASAGCEEEVVTEGGAPPVTPQATATASAGADGDALPPVREFSADDFVESEESRDPFRDFVHLFATKSPERVVERQRPVKASEFALDELKLSGLLTRGHASVMLTDPKGFGWILHIGDYLGKAEMVNVGGTDGTEVPLNWKVDRINSDRVVFIREDPTRPEIPPTTRVMLLYPAGERG